MWLTPTSYLGLDLFMNKNEFRAQLRTHRKNLTAQAIKDSSPQVTRHILQSSLWSNNQHIAIYLPFNGEVDLTELLNDSNKNLYVPSIQSERMQFHLFTPELAIKNHRYGIKQPDFVQGLAEPELDLCLMPLVAFDHKGHRLGMGGGFYDRYFANNQHTILAGVAYQFQQIEQLPTDSWDVKLQYIFTEQGLQSI